MFHCDRLTNAVVVMCAHHYGFPALLLPRLRSTRASAHLPAKLARDHKKNLTMPPRHQNSKLCDSLKLYAGCGIPYRRQREAPRNTSHHPGPAPRSKELLHGAHGPCWNASPLKLGADVTQLAQYHSSPLHIQAPLDGLVDPFCAIAGTVVPTQATALGIAA